MLVHRQFLREYSELVSRCGLACAQQFWDHVANTPGAHSPINRTTVLKGNAGAPDGQGFSRTIHYEISGAARINFQFCDSFQTGTDDEPHPIVRIKTISFTSH